MYGSQWPWQQYCTTDNLIPFTETRGEEERERAAIQTGRGDTPAEANGWVGICGLAHSMWKVLLVLTEGV